MSDDDSTVQVTASEPGRDAGGMLLDARPTTERPTNRPFRFGLRSLGVIATVTAALYAVPQQAFATGGVLAVALVVLGGACAFGIASTAVLKEASRSSAVQRNRAADAYFFVSAVCFVALCIIAPAAVLIGAHAWYGFDAIEPRAILLAATSGGGLLLAAVFAVAGAVLLRSPDGPMRLAWAKIDLGVQLFALASTLGAIAILY